MYLNSKLCQMMFRGEWRKGDGAGKWNDCTY